MFEPKKIVSLMGALLMAFFIWFVHTMSLNYTDYVQYSVEVDADIPGHSGVAIANELLTIRGDSDGFTLVGHKLTRGGGAVIKLKLEESLLHPAEGVKDLYFVNTSEIRERISQAVSENLKVEYIENQQLTFIFPEKSFKTVEVSPTFDIRCRSQYMLVGDIETFPDSVVIYGDVATLDKIQRISTRAVSLSDVFRSENGAVALETIEGVRVSEKEVKYSFKVSRYVENKEEIGLTTINVPAGKHIRMIPSRVTVTYRIPFAKNMTKLDNPPSFGIDYNDFAN